MSPSGRSRRFSRKRRSESGARGEPDKALREFVYLDEVSVFSLVSSRLGSVTAELTETESSSLTAELNAAAGLSAGLFKADIRSRGEGTHSQGTQILRKATVQATFNELYESVKAECGLRPVGSPPDVKNAPNLRAALDLARADRWATPAHDLTRGGIVEVEVELETEDLYRVWAIVGAFVELLQEAPELITGDVADQLREARSMNGLLDRLLGGLVPVRGRSVDFLSVRDGTEEWVVHRRIVEQLDEIARQESAPLDVVAVAEAGLFWKDLRRVLFSRSRYVVLCRVGRDALHTTWTPVKLADVVQDLFPEVAEQFSSTGRDLIEAISQAKAPSATNVVIRIRAALEAYGRGLAATQGCDWDAGLLTDDLFQMSPGDSGNLEWQRERFEALTSRLRDAWGIDPSREEMAQRRFEALMEAGLTPPLAQADSGSRSGSPSPSGRPEPDSRLLDTELIAIYW